MSALRAVNSIAKAIAAAVTPAVMGQPNHPGSRAKCGAQAATHEMHHHVGAVEPRGRGSRSPKNRALISDLGANSPASNTARQISVTAAFDRHAPSCAGGRDDPGRTS